MRLQLTHSLHRQLQQQPSTTASVFRGRRRTWKQLADRASRLAAALQGLGLQRRDRVGMLALNSDIYLEYMLGTWWAGGALNPVNIRWSPAEIAFSLDDCETRVLLIDKHFATLGAELSSRSSFLRVLIYVGDDATPPSMLNYEELLAGTAPVADAECGGEDLAGIFYTGGTTGFPKGVLLSHNALLSNAVGGLLDLNYSDDDIILVVAPLFHQAGMCIVNRAFVRGRPSVLVEAFDPVQVLQAIATERATFTLLVPTMLQRLVDCPAFGQYDLRSLRRILYGASPISEGLLVRALQALPGVELAQGYGMTETGGPYTVLPAWCHRLGGDMQRLRSAGRASWGMEMRIVDLEGTPVPAGQVGEIVARGAGIMQGYWNRERETVDAFRDGWLRSGDMAYMDEEGFVYIIDRLKDMIVTGGENVFSAEVENALGCHAAVASCAVIGIPDDRWGEAVHAVVVLRSGTQATADELRTHCKGLIAGYKCPVSVEFRESLPLSGTGKLLKHVLREPYWECRARRVG
ncbi:MAG: acyl-CoA synthetase [Xanthobacteraceae bacterium]